MTDKPMYEVKVPNSLMEVFSNTPTMLGKENPDVAKELAALKWGSKGAAGEVSLATLGWMSEVALKTWDGGDLKPAALKAVRAAQERYAEAYAAGQEAEAPEEPAGVLVDGVSVPPSFGLPVYHVKDKTRVVGFLTPGNAKFLSVEEAKVLVQGKEGGA
ncbi:hypothetical protein ACFY5K_25615 [Streptomyces griseofuscus]|uniref:hypothetical protein n=1 Tax=Streptomyces griseofuscus TaxID=146922 RepID=UPI0036C87806